MLPYVRESEEVSQDHGRPADHDAFAAARHYEDRAESEPCGSPRWQEKRPGRVVRWDSEVGKAHELAEVQADRVIDATDMVITPGFCNGHMHISYAHATRGIPRA